MGYIDFMKRSEECVCVRVGGGGVYVCIVGTNAPDQRENSL